MASILARGLVIQGRGGFRGALARCLGHKLPQFCGISDHRPWVGMRRRPGAQLFKETVHVVASLGRELVLDPPNLFENGIRFHPKRCRRTTENTKNAKQNNRLGRLARSPSGEAQTCSAVPFLAFFALFVVVQLFFFDSSLLVGAGCIAHYQRGGSSQGTRPFLRVPHERMRRVFRMFARSASRQK